MGLWLGYLLHYATGAWLGGVWVSVGFGGAILVAVAAFWVVFRKLGRGRLGRLEKGEDAEVRAGQFIEHALTAPDCAVAHSVTAIARIGDIDHLVATPVRLWVIETKYRRVPREHFPEVLRRTIRPQCGSGRRQGPRCAGVWCSHTNRGFTARRTTTARRQSWFTLRPRWRASYGTKPSASVCWTRRLPPRCGISDGLPNRRPDRFPRVRRCPATGRPTTDRPRAASAYPSDAPSSTPAPISASPPSRRRHQASGAALSGDIRLCTASPPARAARTWSPTTSPPSFSLQDSIPSCLIYHFWQREQVTQDQIGKVE